MAIDFSEHEVLLKAKISRAANEEDRRVSINILRRLYIDNRIPVCNGSRHCYEYAYEKCVAGKHDTCPKHTGDCISCQTESSN